MSASDKWIYMDRNSKIEIFTLCVDMYIPLVARTSFRILCDRNDSEIVSAMVFRKLWKMIDKVNFSQMRLLMLRLTCRFCVLRLLRRMVLLPFQIRPSLFVTSSAADPSVDDYIKKEAWEIFCRASEKLSVLQRLVYTLHELEELSLIEVSEILNLKPHLIATALTKARKIVRNELSRYGKVVPIY